MNVIENKFELGELVVFKNHPLLENEFIRGDGKFVPPIMIIKEIVFENKQKKTHDETTGVIIAERKKYLCIYFDDNKGEFFENYLYESVLEKVNKLYIEDTSYTNNFEYAFGKIIYFKTKKLETLKRRTFTTTVTTKKIEDEQDPGKTVERETVQHVVCFASPDFIVTGFKKEIQNDLFFNDGKPKRIACSELVKVQWYNPIQHKFSEQYLPYVCFTDVNPFSRI